MCSTSSSLHWVQTVYLLRHCRAYIGGASFTHMTQLVRLSRKTLNRSVDSCNKVLLWRYRSTIHLTLHTAPQKIVERCQIWWPYWPRNYSSATNPSTWICNVEVIPHISIKVRRWLKGYIPAVLGHQNESEQIVTPVNSQTSTFYSTQPCVSGQGLLLEQWCLLPAQPTKHCECSFGIPSIFLKLQAMGEFT